MYVVAIRLVRHGAGVSVGHWEKAAMHAAERSRFSRHGEVDFILCNERLPAETGKVSGFQ